MKSYFLFPALLFSFFVSYGQRVYHSSQFKGILSFANISTPAKDINTIVRYAPVFNYSHDIHIDPFKNFGLYTGLEIKNIGIIIKDTIRSKHRAYSVGIPLAVKIGSMNNNLYFFIGGQYEYLAGYKQKYFVKGEKIKRSGFNDGRFTKFLPSLFAGVQFKDGYNISFQYYLGNFFNKNFTDPQTQLKPYAGMTSNLFLISVGFRLMFKKQEKTKKELKA